ncbi:MAG: ABC transporter ATP-binding protein, partial [Caulobacteraceae bacterium]
PTAGVDVELRRQLWERVQQLNAEGVTIVLTTHYLEEAQELCDTIAIVNRGQVVACEPTAQLLRRMDSRTMVITPQTPLLAAPPLGAFDSKLRPDGRLAITFKSEAADIEGVLASVRAAGISIRDLSTEDPDLEDVFLAMTYNDPQAASPTAF